MLPCPGFEGLCGLASAFFFLPRSNGRNGVLGLGPTQPQMTVVVSSPVLPQGPYQNEAEKGFVL